MYLQIEYRLLLADRMLERAIAPHGLVGPGQRERAGRVQAMLFGHARYVRYAWSAKYARALDAVQVVQALHVGHNST
jgi:hypothetical protein